MNYKKIIFIIFVSIFLSAERNANAQTYTFNYTGALQTFTIPTCVFAITVEADGAQGGANGGLGAKVIGTFNYSSGTVLNILVGGEGGSNDNSHGSGGGGSFVVLASNDTILAIAGGGGGHGAGGIDTKSAGSAGRAGQSPAGSGTPATGGGGGAAGGQSPGGVGCQNGANEFGYCWASGGGGFCGNGGNYSGNSTLGGTSFLLGGTGGQPNIVGGNASGGFGGGGGCGDRGAGGGGYSGGAGGTDNALGGGGGGSYNAGTNQANTTGVKLGNGLVIITVGGGAPLTISAQTNPICGLCNGSLTATTGFGGSPYTYYWAPTGQTTQTATGLCPNTYTVTVTDSCGDISTLSAVLPANPLPVTANVTANEKCNGNCIGSITATVGIGTPPYTYSWTPSGGNQATATGLCAGAYTVTVTDINGCTGTATAPITEPAAIIVSSMTNNVVCSGGIDTAAVSVTGGASPYTYLWAPSGLTTAIVTGLSTGTYTVKVTDLNGCTESTSVNVLHPPLLTATMGIPNNVLCNGGIGSVTVIAGGGIAPYTYLWNPSAQTNAFATGLIAGAYTVTVTDKNGCTATANVTITQPATLMANISPLTNPLCNGGAGSATADPTGGTLPYTYLWTPSAQTNALATGLSARTYTVTITDNNGCTATAAATLTQPTLLTASVSATSILCNGETSNATVSATGGVSPYTYLWNPSAQTNALATSLSAGSYTVNVTDNNACTATASITITQPAVLTATMSSIIHSSCNLANGAATVSVTGGTLPYFYIWSPGGQTKAQATDLGVGTYTVDVTDHNGCTASAMATITQPTLVTAVITATTNITCYNGNNGAITVKANGGSLPYTYLWTPSNYTTASPNNLFALTYTVTVTDANGCTATETTTLTQPAQLAVSITEPKTICKDSTGNILGNVTGGISPYTYVWSGGNTSVTSTATITPIATNNYSVEVTDNNGCTASTNIILKYGPNLFVNITGKNSVCSGYTTTICASVTGGQGGNFYVWSPSNNTNACITVTPGITSTYTVQVVDGCGATTTANTTLYTNSSPVINMSADVVQGCVPLCIQFHNATTLSKGNIMQYVWNFGNKDTSKSISPVYCYANSGSYNVSLTAITDSGCSATLDKVNMITVYKHPNAAFTYSPQDVNIETPEVQFTDESTDASGIAYWMWNFGDLSNSTSTLQNPIHTYKDTGNYCADLIVMDTHGCTDTATNCLVIGSAFKLYIPSAFTPNGDGMDDIFIPVGKYIKNFEMYIFDRWGIELYHSTNINEGWNGAVNGGTTISQEDVYVYKIMVTDAEDTQHSYVGKVTLIK